LKWKISIGETICEMCGLSGDGSMKYVMNYEDYYTNNSKLDRGLIGSSQGVELDQGLKRIRDFGFKS